jgi:hypothetical protein
MRANDDLDLAGTDRMEDPFPDCGTDFALPGQEQTAEGVVPYSHLKIDLPPINFFITCSRRPPFTYSRLLSTV